MDYVEVAVGISDSFRDMTGKAKQKMNPDKAKEGVDKASDRLDQATGGKFSKHVDRGQETAKSGIDRIFEEDEEQPR